MASLAEFERDLVRERVCSGLAAAQAKGKKLGRKPGQRVKADKYAPQVLQMVSEGNSYRYIAQKLHLSKTSEKAKFSYLYDFGDSWEHSILVEKILPKDPNVSYPLCLKAKRACPPEDL